MSAVPILWYGVTVTLWLCSFPNPLFSEFSPVYKIYTECQNLLMLLRYKRQHWDLFLNVKYNADILTKGKHFLHYFFRVLQNGSQGNFNWCYRFQRATQKGKSIKMYVKCWSITATPSPPILSWKEVQWVLHPSVQFPSILILRYN